MRYLVKLVDFSGDDVIVHTTQQSDIVGELVAELSLGMYRDDMITVEVEND